MSSVRDRLAHTPALPQASRQVASTQPGYRRAEKRGTRGSVPGQLEEASPWGWWQLHCFWCYSSGAAERGREAIRERMRGSCPFLGRGGGPEGASGIGQSCRLEMGAGGPDPPGPSQRLTLTPSAFLLSKLLAAALEETDVMSEGPGSQDSPLPRREAASGACEEPGLPKIERAGDPRSQGRGSFCAQLGTERACALCRAGPPWGRPGQRCPRTLVPGTGPSPRPSAMTWEDTKVSPPTCDQRLPGGQHAGSPKRKAGLCPSPEMGTQGRTAGWSGRHPHVLRQGWVGCRWPPTKGGACPNPRCLLSASWPPSPGRQDSELSSHGQASGHASQLRAPGGQPHSPS